MNVQGIVLLYPEMPRKCGADGRRMQPVSIFPAQADLSFARFSAQKSQSDISEMFGHLRIVPEYTEIQMQKALNLKSIHATRITYQRQITF